ncbi:XP_028572535.1uncharacterized protein LOC114590431 [Podarcis lilfordi]|uniref:XP_028572535.1uncharacterized protein LOC114590431 n=1 Tax=Podarcis lilfordi TaxID=74358 RepID=A0AA35LNP2_9SAUR|nr:XP_028572535.1uncharacterized protein LOC114590431 [Podarcis lilfordi]
MANRGNAQTPQSGGALVPVEPCNPQAIAQLVSAIQAFYAQCGPPDTPAQHSTSEGSSSDDELPPQQAASASNDPAPRDSSSRGGKRKAKRKHVSKKSRRRDPSDSEDETAGDEAAISYDEDFRRNASLLSSKRWDQRDNNYWMEHVGPNIEKKTHDQAKPGKVDAKRRKQCWDFNRGACQRTACKYLHECDKCLGSHPAINCFKGKQQPFRGGRGHLHQGNQGAPSGASGPAQGSTGNRY